MPEPSAVAALGSALESDSFWSVRAAAATALGKTRRQDALDALLRARAQENPRVRRAVAAALGDFVITHAPGNQRAAEMLEGWVVAGDASCFVEATAALALGRTRSPRAVAVLPGVLSRNSFQDMIRARAIEGLGATGDETALPLVETAFVPGASIYARRAVVAALARLAEGTLHVRRARERIEGWLADPDFRVRMESASALALLADGRAVPAIEAALHAELDGRAKRRMREAISELREKGKPDEKTRKLSQEVERLSGETTRLRERLEGLENTRRPLVTTTPNEPSPGGAPPTRNRRPRPGSRRSGKPLAPRRRR
jgi:aminopeptidase N